MDKYSLSSTIISAMGAVVIFACQPIAAQNISPERVHGWVVQLQSPDPNVRRRIVNVLKYAGPAAETAVPALSTALNDTDMDVRMGASQALAHLGAVANSAVPALIGALDDKQSCLREAAAIALGSIGPGAQQAIAKLQFLSNSDSDMLVRRLASDAVQKIQRP